MGDRYPSPKRSCTLRQVAAVEAAEQPREEQAHQENAEHQRHDVSRSPQSKIADAADEDVADDDIEEAPKHVHGRRGKSLPRRLREWALEWLSHHTADEMRNGIC